MVCADTSFLVALERCDTSALEKMQKLDNDGEMVFTTAVTVAEFYRGAYRSEDRFRALKDAKGLLDGFAILQLDDESARIWGELAQSLKSDAIHDRDLFVASIALANKQGLITRDTKSFEKVPGLTVETW